MELKKCKECKQVFSPVGNEKKCPDCREKEEEKYRIVKDYLWDNPGATVKKISEETEVSEELITKFVREGRFVQIDGVDLKVECERCGKKIDSGRFCEECQEELEAGLKGRERRKKSKKKKRRAEKEKMYTHDRHKRK